MAYYISSGMTSSGIQLDGALMTVYNGGSVNNTTVTRGGGIYVHSGGTAENTIISEGWIEVYSGGKVNTAVVNNFSEINVSGGGTANQVTVNSGGTVEVLSSGTLNNAVVNSGGRVVVYYGASAKIAYNPWQGTVDSRSGAQVTYLQRDAAIYYGNAAGGLQDKADRINDFTVTSGKSAIIYSGGVVSNLAVYNYGNMFVSSGGMLCGSMRFSAQAAVSAYAGAKVDFTLTDRTTADDALIINLNLIKGAPTYTITVAADQACGTYKLATGAGNFTQSVSIGDGCKAYGTITVNGDALKYNNIEYTLKQTAGTLLLDVQNAATVFVYSSGALIASGTRINNTTLASGGNDSMYISSGGFAENTTVSSGGSLTVYSGGAANGITVNCGGGLLVNGGSAINVIENGGFIQVTEDSSAIFTSNTIRSITCSEGTMTIHKNTVAQNIAIESRGYMRVYSGGVVCGTVVNALGSMGIVDGGIVRDTAVNSNGGIYISSGGVHSGSLQIASGAVVSALSGSTIDFTLTNRTAADAALIDNLALISGTPAYTVTIAADQARGVYKLAENASAFDGSVTVDDIDAVLSVGEKVMIDDTVYKLDSADGLLTFSISDAVKVNDKNFAYGGNFDSTLADNTYLLVDGGSYKRFYGGNYVDKSREFADMNGTVDLTVTDGTFSSVVAAGDHVVNGVAERVGAITAFISGGTFANNVAGGMCLDVAAENFGYVTAIANDINLTIAGGTFAKRIFGGNISSKAAQSGHADVKGDINLTLDASNANITVKENIAAGSSGYSWVHGNVTVTLKKSADFTLSMSGMLSGGSEGAVYMTDANGKRTAASYVAGERTLVLDGYDGDFDGTLFMFEKLEVRHNTAMNFTNAKLNTGDISSWIIEYGSTVTGLQRNTFDGDTLDFDLTNWDGTGEWEVLSGTSVSFADIGEAAGVTLGGQNANWNGSAWVSTDYKLAVDDSESKLVLTTLA